MRIKVISILLLAFAIILIESCRQQGVGPMGPVGLKGSSGPQLTGTMQGWIKLYNIYGDRIYTAQNIDSIEVVNYPLYDSTTTSGTNGNGAAPGQYIFSNLTTGTYTLHFRYTGVLQPVFAPTQLQSIQLIGGTNATVNRDVSISAIPPPTYSVTALNIYDTLVGYAYYVKITGAVNMVDSFRPRTIAVFVTLGSTSVTNTSYLWNIPVTIAPLSKTFSYYSPNNPNSMYLGTQGITSTTTTVTYSVSATAYPAAANYQTSSAYEDYTTGMTVFNAISLPGQWSATGAWH